VKSALLLAGLYAEGETVVTEPAVTRDHSERMLACFGVDVARSGDRVTLQPPRSLTAGPIAVPGDLSSAAFFLLGACTIPGSELIMEQVGLNPTRTGVLKILELMGADFEIETLPASVDREPMARLTVRYAPLQGIEVPAELVPLAIDEFPVLFVAAALAQGTTTISGAAELRHKESDRIGVMAEGLRALGVAVEEFPDGARIQGGRLCGGSVNSHGDHRVAMAFAMAAATADGPVKILDTANVNTSFPGFAEIAAGVGLDIRVVNSG
jgi:3-phosphoshikimate 1-carboxyvinyltransferase